MSLMNVNAKIVNKILTNQVQQHEQTYTLQLSEINSTNARLIYYSKTIIVIHYINMLKAKPHGCLGRKDNKKNRSTNPACFMISHSQKQEQKGNFLSLIKKIHKNTAKATTEAKP